MAADIDESLGAPMLRLPLGAGEEDGEGTLGKARSQQHRRRFGLGLRREMDGEIRPISVEAEQIAQPEVPVGGVEIHARHRNVMGIGKPRALAGARKADAYGRAARPDEDRSAELAVHIDHEIIVIAPDLSQYLGHLEATGPAPSELAAGIV